MKNPTREKPEPNKMKEGIKMPRNKTKLVSEFENEIDKSMLSETIDDIVMEFTQQGKSTGLTLGGFWVRCMIAEYPNRGYTPTKLLTRKQYGQLKHLTTDFSDDIYNTLGMVLLNWESFTEHAKKTIGAFGIPEYPTIDFLLKWRDAIPSFKIANSRVAVEKNTTREFEKIMKMPTGKQLL